MTLTFVVHHAITPCHLTVFSRQDVKASDGEAFVGDELVGVPLASVRIVWQLIAKCGTET
jgi:hypothetical protein